MITDINAAGYAFGLLARLDDRVAEFAPTVKIDALPNARMGVSCGGRTRVLYAPTVVRAIDSTTPQRDLVALLAV